MTEITLPDEKAIIKEILRRRSLGLTGPRIPGEHMKIFKEKLGEEIQRNGKLSQEFVDGLLTKLKNGEL
jgi:hypothetical protein